MQHFIVLFGSAIFLGVMALASLSDLRTYRIPNVYSVVLIVVSLILMPIAGFSLDEIGASALTAFVVLLAGFTLFAFGVIGGGDAKIASAAVLWMSPTLALKFLLFASLIGGVMAIFLLSFRYAERSALLPAPFYKMAWSNRLANVANGIPYGAAFGLAAFIVFPETHWFALAFG